MTEKVGQYGESRFWEMVPGVLVWTTFALALGTSFFAPTLAVIFIIIFDLYWTMRVLYFLIFVIHAYLRFQKARRIDWIARLKKQDGWEDVYHLVLLPTYKEGLTILRDALSNLATSDYPNDKFLVVLGGEEGDKENFERYANTLQEEFGDTFGAFVTTLHPRGLTGELPGKGSNLNWMEKRAQELIDKRGIAYDKIIATAFDVDTLAHKQYFARLTYLFLTVDNPLRASYQPVVLYSNNLWEAKAPVRISMFGTTFWLMSELVRSDRMWTFSSHSMSWQMLVDVGFHEPNLVSEDSRIFLQGLLHYDGDYRVEPMFLPVYMDAVDGDTYKESLWALYKQQRRWAWGVEHLPYMMTRFKDHPNMPLTKKLRFFFNHIEGMYTWATAPMLIFILGYLPFIVLSQTPTALLANSPFTLQWMMRIATIGVFASAFLSLWLIPKRPKGKGPLHWLVMIFQWALLPVTFILFGALPSIDAQTRMMFGKYLGFNVTKKKR